MRSTTGLRGKGGMPKPEWWRALQEEHQYDPRPDLEDDAHLWRVVLAVALEADREVYGVLHGVRWLGGHLFLEEDALNLEPRIGEGIRNGDDWWDLRVRWLVPHTTSIARIVKDAGRALKKRRFQGGVQDDKQS